MLAYDLYLRNKDYKGEAVKRQKPIKKIFVNKNQLTLDPKLKEHYGGNDSQESKQLQNWLSMPLNTANAGILNLPNKSTGSRSAAPYIQIYGVFEVTKTLEPKLELSISTPKGGTFVSKLNLTTSEDQITAKGRITLNLDKKNYSISGKNLFDAYVKSGIIDNNGAFDSTTFVKISRAFFQYAKKRKLEPVRARPVKFSLFVLPSNGSIEYLETAKKFSSESFVDCFGNRDSRYASKPTKTGKFLSYDDPAFTINCTSGEKFYKNLSIGETSLDKINLPADDVFNIAGLNWIFINVSDPSFHFEKTGKGIYSQLYENYNLLKKRSSLEIDLVQMKIICFKTQQAKLEVLIDENMTMKRMQELFERANVPNIQPLLFEILIDKSNKNPIWGDYLNAVRSFIVGNYVERFRFLTILSKLLKRNIHGWLKENNVADAVDFFKKSDFCLKVLSTSKYLREDVKAGEEYAYKIGKISGKYVNFKKEAKEESNSLRDILTYSKYDREKLRFVMTRVGQGVNLSKITSDKMDVISNFIKANLPEIEIPDNEAFEDYSYFFYKGLYEVLGDMRKE